MGIVLGTIDKQYYMAYRNQLEEKVSELKLAKMHLASSASELINAGTDMDPESPMVKQLEQRKARLNLLEKKLDMELDEAQNKLKMIDGNLEAAHEELDKSITRKV